MKTLPKLSQSFSDLDPNRITEVHCKSGYRSFIADSLQQRAGFKEVVNVIAGYDARAACGLS